MEHCAMGSAKGKRMFAKYWRVSDRIANLNEIFGSYLDAGWHVNVNDYTSWEANMQQKLQMVCEIQFYRYMLKNIDKKIREDIMKVVIRVIAGTNHCTSRFGSVDIKGTRMSGEMSTSLGNGITNLVCTSFVLSRKGIRNMMVVEGDDAVIVTEPGDYEVTSQDFAEVGLKAKFKRVENLADAEFCSVMAALDVKDNIADVFDVFNRTGWSMANERYAKPSKCLGLLRAKAISLVYEFPRAPVVRSFANYLLRVTNSHAPIFEHGKTTELKWWDEQVLKGVDMRKLPPGNVENSSRALVARKYHVDLAIQLKYESYFDQLNHEIEWIPNFCFMIPHIRKEHFDRFVRYVPDGYVDALVRW